MKRVRGAEWLQPYTCEIRVNGMMHARIVPFFPTTELVMQYDNNTITFTAEEIIQLINSNET